MVSVAASAATAIAVALIALLWLRVRWAGGRAIVHSRRGPVPGLDVSNSQFWFAVVGVACATYLAVYSITRLPVVSLAPALVVATLPRAYFHKRRNRRMVDVQESWPDGLRDILSSVRSGSSLPSAIDSLAVFGPPALREAFQGFGVYSRSLGVTQALEMIREDLADPTSDRVIEVLVLAYERGGSAVPEILADLAEATTRDLWALEQVRSEALEQKLNSRIVFVLPWLVLVAMTAQSGAFREFYSTPAGLMVAVFGGIMSLVGIFLASKLGAQPVEPRVFGGQD